MQKQTIALTTSSGIHARPAALLVRTSNKFTSKITVYAKDNTELKADAKSITSIFALGISEGKKIIVEAEGEDEKEAIATIVNVLGSLK